MKANYYAASVQVSVVCKFHKDKREKHVRILSVAKQSSEAKLTGGFWLHQLSAYSFSGLSLCTVHFTKICQIFNIWILTDLTTMSWLPRPTSKCVPGLPCPCPCMSNMKCCCLVWWAELTVLSWLCRAALLVKQLSKQSNGGKNISYINNDLLSNKSVCI